MKRILFVLLLLPNLLFAETYTYNMLSFTEKGSDNFSVDKNANVYCAGTIELNGNSITIDKKTYELKPMRRENYFKCKGEIFRLVYAGSRLSYVEHHTFNKILNYRIQNNAQTLRVRNSG